MGIMEKKMETTIVYWGYIGIMEKKMETTVTIVYWGYMGIMEKKMETTIVYWGYIGILEKKMETTIMGYIGVRGSLGGLKGSYFQAERGVGKGPFCKGSPEAGPKPGTPKSTVTKPSQTLADNAGVMDSMLE